jgi:glycosyltransferase involved in cell wall biosynthesis
MEKLSLLILTYNEETHIARCLESASFADEIIIVDALSTDKTKAICTQAHSLWSKKIKFLERPWSGFRDQRNYSLEQATYDWVFVLDADEAISNELKDKLQSLLSNHNGPPFQAYQVRRIEYFLGKKITNGIWNPSYQDRFFNKNGVQYINEIHEFPKFKSPPQRLHEAIHHSPFFNSEKFLDKMNKYTSVEAMDRYKKGQRTTIFKIIFAFPAMFLKNYFYYKAYKDGIHGLIISLLEGVSRVVRHIKIWQLMEHNKKP